MACCPRLPEESTYQAIEATATAETSPLLDKAIAGLADTLNDEQRRMLTQIEDLFAAQAGALIEGALNFKACCRA